MQLEAVDPGGAGSRGGLTLPSLAGEEPQIFVDSVQVGPVCLRIAGIAVERDGERVTGSAGGLTCDPLPRAVMELRERLAVMDAIRASRPHVTLVDGARRRCCVVPAARAFPPRMSPAGQGSARSNGVAAAGSWAVAAERARLELIERDGVLRSWYGDASPVRVNLGSHVPQALFGLYDFEAYSFGDEAGSASVAGVFGFPGREHCEKPLVYGFGAGHALAGAVESASRECLQRLGFLFGEPLPTSSPEPAPIPEFHQEFYLYPPHHERLKRWLEGGHLRFRGLLGAKRLPREPLYVDLTPRGAVSFVVAKAVPNGHLQLHFGVAHPAVETPLPVELRVHPIA